MSLDLEQLLQPRTRVVALYNGHRAEVSCALEFRDGYIRLPLAFCKTMMKEYRACGELLYLDVHLEAREGFSVPPMRHITSKGKKTQASPAHLRMDLNTNVSRCNIERPNYLLLAPIAQPDAPNRKELCVSLVYTRNRAVARRARVLEFGEEEEEEEKTARRPKAVSPGPPRKVASQASGDKSSVPPAAQPVCVVPADVAPQALATAQSSLKIPSVKKQPQQMNLPAPPAPPDVLRPLPVRHPDFLLRLL